MLVCFGLSGYFLLTVFSMASNPTLQAHPVRGTTKNNVLDKSFSGLENNRV